VRSQILIDLSLAEKLIEELEKSPELAERFKKIIQSAALDAIATEQRLLRSDFNRLLEEMKKIAQEQTKLRVDFTKIVEEQKSLREDFNKLSEEQKRLREDFMQLRTEFASLVEEQKKLREDFNKLSEEQKRLREDFMQLRVDFTKIVEEQNKLSEEQKRLREDFMQLRVDFTKIVEEQKSLREDFNKLREDFNKMLLEISELKKGYGRLERRIESTFNAMISGLTDLSKYAGLTLEDFTRKILENYLKGMGVLPSDRSLRSETIDSEQIDIFCEDPAIVGEVTAYAESTKEAEKLLKKASVVRQKLGKEPKKYLLVMTTNKQVYKDIQKISEENEIELIVGRVV
jgi:chromosome segregation ATPase